MIICEYWKVWKKLFLNVFIIGINRIVLREIKFLQELKYFNIIGVRIKDLFVCFNCISDRGFEIENYLMFF